MKTFIVSVKEVHIQRIEVEAETKEDACFRVADGQGKELGKPEYSYTLTYPYDFAVEEKVD